MSAIAASLKDRIRQLARMQAVPSQMVLQGYLFERFLERLSRSPHRDRFVLKGGLLVSSLLGIGSRCTMDMDATLRGMSLEIDAVRRILEEISAIQLDDATEFLVGRAEPIREKDLYGGFRFHLEARYDTIRAPFCIDISTGDAITPAAVEHEFRGMLSSDVRFCLWSYPVETILAEKVESVLVLGPLGTRPRDFYDIHALVGKGDFRPDVFRDALFATMRHRGTLSILPRSGEILEAIKHSELSRFWIRYQTQYAYARTISFEDALNSIRHLVGGVQTGP